MAFAVNALGQKTVVPDYIDHEQKLASVKMNFQSTSTTTNYDIIYHKIFWKVDPGNYFIEGAVTSYFKVLIDSLRTIHFDLINELTVDSILWNKKRLQFTHHENLIRVDLEQVLYKNEIDSLTIYYKGIPDASSGFTAFDTATHDGVPSLWTLSEPYGAREWWPCKQSLSDKIDSIDIYVETPKQYKVASNGKLMFEHISANNKLTYWKHRYPIATYLVAIAVTNYAEFSHYADIGQGKQVQILNYVYPEDVDWAKPDAEATVRLMEFFSDIFIPYPFYEEKYGHAQFAWGGGMEHQTMSFMKHFSEPLIAHELAHQWFGDYVTCASWQHIWINEGFAEFSESLVQERFYPNNWNDWKKAEIDAVIKNTESGSVFVDDTTDVSRIFDRYLTYKKGGLILQLLRNQVGDDAFFNGMKNYLNHEKIAGGFATAEDFKKFIEQVADTNLTQFFTDWYYGQGFPSYEIDWTQDSNNKITLTISQSTSHASVPFFALKIPLLLIGNSKEQLVILHNTSNSQTFEIKTDFYVNEIKFDPNYNIIAPHPADIKYIIGESDNSEVILLMPNPANNLLSVKADRGISFSKVEILSTTGRQMHSNNYNLDTRKADIDIGSFQAGVYYVRVMTSKGEVIKRFVKTSNI